MPHTRADILRFSIAYHLRKAKAGRQHVNLTEDDRYRIAEDVVRDLVRLDQWPELTAEVNVLPPSANYSGDLRGCVEPLPTEGREALWKRRSET